MTNEGKSVTESWVESKGANYPYAYDPGGKLQSWAGVRGIPHALLVDPEGEIVWRGHPGTLSSAEIEKAVQGALPTPVYEWSASASGVKKALLKRDYGRALEEARKLSPEDDGPAIVGFIEARVRARVERMDAALAAGDFLEAQTIAEDLVRSTKGLPAADRAEEVLASVKDHPDAAKILAGQKQLAKLEEAARELRKQKDADKLIDKAKKLRKKYPNTIIARHCEDLIRKLSNQRRTLR